MIFIVRKCETLHIGYHNNDYVYEMNAQQLQNVTEETDLGIKVSNDLKPLKQCVSAAKKANMTLGTLYRETEI